MIGFLIGHPQTANERTTIFTGVGLIRAAKPAHRIRLVNRTNNGTNFAVDDLLSNSSYNAYKNLIDCVYLNPAPKEAACIISK